MKVLFVVKAGKITSILHESLDMIIPESYDYILWLVVWALCEIYCGYEILDLEPKPYIYDKDAWLSFKEKINTHQ